MSVPTQPRLSDAFPVSVIIADRFSSEALGVLKAKSRFHVVHDLGFGVKSPTLPTAHALIIRSKTKITQELLAQAPNLKVVVTATNGFDHIDFEACRERGVQVYYCPLGNRDSAAELTWALILACSRKIPFAHRSVIEGRWERNSLYGQELRGKNLGIIGLGRIGTRVAQIGTAFGMNVFAHDPYVEPASFEQAGATRSGLIELFRSSDILTLHVPYTRETHHMINRATLSEMHHHTYIINTSRGLIINEQDLAEFLLQGEIAAAGLDVFEREPVARDSALLSLPNVVLTPHIGANTTEAFDRVSRLAAEKVMAFFEQGPTHLSDSLPPQEPWYRNSRGSDSCPSKS